MLQKFRLKFLGNIYELQGEDPGIDLQEVASYVEQKAAELEQKYSTLPPAKLMVLVAMGLGKDYLSAKKRLDKLQEGLSLKVKVISKKIDAELMKKKD